MSSEKDAALTRHQSQCDDLLLALDRDQQWPEVQRAIFQWIHEHTFSLIRQCPEQTTEGHGPENLFVSAGVCVEPANAWATVHLEKEGQQIRHFHNSVNHLVLSRISPVMRLILLKEGLQSKIAALFRQQAARSMNQMIGTQPVPTEAATDYDLLRQGKITRVTASTDINGVALPKYDQRIWRIVFGE
ncbi:MAG TPA: hypothetical protein VI873_02295 [Candidatus Peribacteraceae bacterium]|nr:hypothetical protein [Candidatus Peribacteraceae bacterium]